MMKKLLCMLFLAFIIGNIYATIPPGVEAVDLGLPSGTLWANVNVGASRPEQPGLFFAWGETKAKTNYTWESYKYCDGTSDSMKKYCTDSDYGRVDKRKELSREDDAASVTWSKEWCIPTEAQWKELIDECTWKWMLCNDKYGFFVYSKKNNNWIFLPAAGYRSGSTRRDLGSLGGYWSRTLVPESPHTAVNVFFNYSSPAMNVRNDRFIGRSIRAVRAK